MPGTTVFNDLLESGKRRNHGRWGFWTGSSWFHLRAYTAVVFVILLMTFASTLQAQTDATAGASEPALQKTPNPSVEPEARWVVDPSVPGEDLPPRGHSLFDELFLIEREDEWVYEIPFPFSSLVTSIESRLVQTNTTRSRARQVLFPLGRSLQRQAAAPDFFKYPRVVVAVDGDSAIAGASLIKDRLFLGYQESASIVEVISYNEQEGRFEFQVVRDYGPDSSPRVFYARRPICMSCHQSGGPIFSVAAWSETASNPGIAHRLLDEQDSYYGIPVHRSGIDAFAVDSSTDRANLFSAYQLLWREGCGGRISRAAGCRASIFTGMLQYRLTGGKVFDTLSGEYRDQFLPVFRDNWNKRWPGGLNIPSPDLPNRDPLSANGQIVAHLDPLSLRQPLETWSIDRPGDIERFIKGISELIPARDIRRLDEYLHTLGLEPARDARRARSFCELEQKRLSGTAYRAGFTCRNIAGLDAGFSMEGALYIEAGRITDGVIYTLDLDNTPPMEKLRVSSSSLEFDDHEWLANLRLVEQRTGLSARLPTGGALGEVALHWADPATVGSMAEPPPVTVAAGEALLSVTGDFAVVRDAIVEMTSQGNDSLFSPAPFSGRRAMQALFTQLGIIADGPVCCSPENRKTAAKVDSSKMPAISGKPVATGPLQVFSRCVVCHRTQVSAPPNFLFGDDDYVEQNITRCLPRIWYRLHMWRVPEAQRQKSPMPPVTALHGLHMSEKQWQASDELGRMEGYAADLLKVANVRTDELMRQDYDTLPECAPEFQP